MSEWLSILFRGRRAYYRPGYGTVRRCDGKWYGANDVRPEVVGTADACEPRVGPFDTRSEAQRALETANDNH